jgi:hypothetical protein
MTGPLGSINARGQFRARIGKQKFTFDGTTLGLVKAAIGEGAKHGTVIHADYGNGMKPCTLVETPWDKRTGFWVQPGKESGRASLEEFGLRRGR